MALSKVITLTVTGHTIKLSTPIKIFQNDQIYLVFRINEYGISVKGGNSEQKKIMPINPLKATLYLETPLGVDSIESASIEDNTVIFHLENKYTQYIGVSKMQIKLTDEDCCQITLPHFDFEVRENIYDNEPLFKSVILTDENGNIVVDENGNVLNVATEIYAKPLVESLPIEQINRIQIQDFNLDENVTGDEDILIQDKGITKRVKAIKLLQDMLKSDMVLDNYYLDDYYTKVVSNMAELQDDIDNNRVYDGMIIYVAEERLTYQYLNPDLIIFGGGSGGDFTGIIIDNLNSMLSNASLSANQGRILREMIEGLQGNYYTKEEIDSIKKILDDKDLEINNKFENISNFLPTKLSAFENDMSYLTKASLEEELKHIKIPVKTSDLENDAGYVTKENIDELVGEIPIKTSQLENDAGYITQENLEENVVNKIPIKTSQLENDSGYITEDNLAENVIDKIPIKTSQLENDMGYITEEGFENLLANADLSGLSGGNGKLHIGDKEPEEKDYLWIDTSPKDNKISSKYVEMLDLTTEKLSNLNAKMTTIEENIGKITSSENQDKIKTFRTTLSTIKNEINVLFLQINNLKSQSLTTLRSESRKTRKATKKLIYSLIDFDDEVMRVLDSELIFDYSGEGGGGNNGDNNDDIVVNNASILTEDGVALLTEDGLLILADGIEEVVVPNNAITDESGKLLLTESGLMLLADEIEKSEVLADAILTELGYTLMTENEKQILKG